MKTLFNSSRHLRSPQSYSYGAVLPCSKKPSYQKCLDTAGRLKNMKRFLHSRDGAGKGAALMITLAFVTLLTGLALVYLTRATTDRQLAHASYNDGSSDLLARSALDIVVNDFKQEILNAGAVTRSNIQPQRSGADPAIPNLIRRSVRNDGILSPPGISSWASAASSGPVDSTNVKRGEVTSARWNGHYFVPRFTTRDDVVDSTPISNFTAPDWVLMTRNGPVAFSGWNNSLKDPSSTNTNYVVGRYAFAVYDEGGLLDMNLAGYPGWPNNPPCSVIPAPTPWLVNVGRKGTMALADLTALGSTSAPLQAQVDQIVGWRNYAMTQRTVTNFFPTGIPGFATDDCTKADFYGSYLLYFGDPPFTIESLADKLGASIYPFTSAAANVWNGRTDQALTSRQQLLRLRSSLGFSQNVLQYMGTFSRERNQPAPDWPNLNGTLSEGRFNMNNLGLLVPNPCDPTVQTCAPSNGKKKGWQTGKNRNHLSGTVPEIVELFGLFWVKAGIIDTNYKTPGHWTYVDHTGPNPPGQPDPNPHSIICFRGANQQEDFFQILHYALNVARPSGADRCAGHGQQPRTFGIGASLIDQYDSGGDCLAYSPGSWAGTGCDLDPDVVTHNGNNVKYATHTTVIRYGQGPGQSSFAFGMEPNYSTIVGSDGYINGDCPAGQTGGGCSGAPHRPCVGDNQFPCAPPNEPPAPTPAASTQVISHAFSNVGEFGYGIDTSATGGPTPLPTLDFSSPSFPDAPVLDFFCYNPISSAYPRAGIVNLYTRNAPVLAAILAGTLKTNAAANQNPPSPVISGTPAASSEAMTAATRIVTEAQKVLAGNPDYGSVTQTDLTRAIAARLAAAAAQHLPGTGNLTEQEQAVARALAEMGQTRTWNLFIDVIAQTGHYGPNAQNLTDFISEGEKRYWLHIALNRDDGTVLGTQLEEVAE